MKIVVIPPSSVRVLHKTLDMLEAKAERGGIPPKAAQSAARRGLELRREFGRGGTMIGVARARDIQNGKFLSERTVRRMKAYFDRHEVDKQGKDWDNPDKPSNGKIAWLLWGGDTGRSWATRMVEKWNREDGTKKSIPRWLPNGDEITELEQLAAVLNVDVKTAAYCVIDSHNPPADLYFKAVRRVRTPQGAIHFGQPIGTIIRRDRESWRGLIDMAVGEGGGITLSFLSGKQPKTGYAVAERGNNLEIPEGEFFDRKRGSKKMMSWIRKHQSKLDKDTGHLGIWHDTDNKEVVLDVSYVVGDRDEAIKLGKRNNQQAIWDIANMQEIDTGGTGDRKSLLAEWMYGKDHLDEANQEVFGHDGRGTSSMVRADNRSGTGQVKDVYAADRTSGKPNVVSGAVTAPFETLKPIVRRKTRDRISRILANWDKHQNAKGGSK